MAKIIQTQYIYEVDDSHITIDEALTELINQAEEWGYYSDHILKTKEKDYLFNSKIMELKEVNWDKEKALEYLKTK